MKEAEVVLAACLMMYLDDSGGVLPLQGYAELFFPGPEITPLSRKVIKKLEQLGVIRLDEDGTLWFTAEGMNKGPGTWLSYAERLLKSG